MMTSREEFERPVSLRGAPAVLYASGGRVDDYVELALPAAATLDSTERMALLSLGREWSTGRIDVAITSGRPPTVSLTALYVGDSAERRAPSSERLARLFAGLAEALPRLDLGDLAPVVVPAPVADESTLAPVASPVAAIPTEPARESSVGPIDPTPSVTAAELVGRARRCAARRQIHKASRLLDDARRLSPGSLEVRALREELSRLDGREKRRQRDPKSAQAQLEAGFSYLVIGCDAVAVAALREATRLHPGLYRGWLLLGTAYHYQGREAEARASYEMAARLRPLDETPRELLAALFHGEAPPRPVEERRPLPRPQLSAFGGPRWAAAG
jgi:hypothetical protein